MAEWSIPKNNLVAKFLGSIKPSKPVNEGVTNPVESTPVDTETPWPKMLGVNISGTSAGEAEETFTETDFSYLAKYLKNIPSDVAERITASVSGIDSMDFDVIEKVVPESFQDTYAELYANGTANRIENQIARGLGASDIYEAANGNHKLLDVAGLLFQDAEYQKSLS